METNKVTKQKIVDQVYKTEAILDDWRHVEVEADDSGETNYMTPECGVSSRLKELGSEEGQKIRC